MRSGTLRVSAAAAGIRFQAARWVDGFPNVQAVQPTSPRRTTWQLAVLLGTLPTPSEMLTVITFTRLTPTQTQPWRRWGWCLQLRLCWRCS